MKNSLTLTKKVLIFGIGIFLQTPIFATTPSSPPLTSSAPNGGYFSRYFQNIVWTGDCAGGSIVTGFDNTVGNTYGTKVCSPLDNLIKSFFSSYVPEVPGQVLAWFDGAGDPIYTGAISSPWGVNGTSLYYNGGNVWIGTNTPWAALEIMGQIKITGGSPGNGKVLTSDADWLASWWNAWGWATTCLGTGVGNTCYGSGSFVANTTWSSNTSVGTDALSFNTTWIWNVANGAWALRTNDAWSFNTAIGTFSLYWNTSGNFNTALGNGALQNTYGNNNTAVWAGIWASLWGDNNILIGYWAQAPFVTGNNQLSIWNWIYGDNGNIGIGVATPGAKLEINGQVKITGGNPWVGKVLTSDASGLASWQAVIGGASETVCPWSWTDNTCYWLNTLSGNTTWYQNTAYGRNVLKSNTTARNNVWVWSNSLFQNTTGNGNVGIWNMALFQNTIWWENIAIWTNALMSNQNGSTNTAIWSYALTANTTAWSNTAVWYYSLYSNTVWDSNTAIWSNTMRGNISWWSNTALGQGALYNNNWGVNTGLGAGTLFNNINGDYNVAVWDSALNGITNSNYNVALWVFAWQDLVSGDNNIAIWYAAQVPSANASNQVRIWNTNITYAGIQVPWTITSDRRWKEDIHDMPLWLSFINSLHPVDYFRKNDTSRKRESWFIAQEFDESLKKFGYENSGIISQDEKGFYSLRYNDLFAPIVKSIQEISSTQDIEDLKIDKLEKENMELKSRIEALEERMK